MAAKKTSSFAADLEKRKQINRELSSGDFSSLSGSSNGSGGWNTELIVESAPAAVKEQVKSTVSSGSSGQKSGNGTTVKSSKSPVGDTAKKASNSSGSRTVWLDDDEHETGTPVEPRDRASAFDENVSRRFDPRESISFVPRFTGRGAVFGEVVRSAFPGADEGADSRKNRTEELNEVKRDPSVLYKKDTKDSSFYNDFERRRNLSDNPFSLDRREEGEDNGQSKTVDLSIGTNMFERPSEFNVSPFENEPELIEDHKELTDEAEEYVSAGVRLDDVLSSKRVVSREESRKAINNVMYDVVTYTFDDGRTEELIKGSTHTKELDANYLTRYMTEDQLVTYYYIRGKFGKADADEYLYDDVVPEAENADFYNLNVERNRDFAAEHPVITAAITPFTGARNVVQGASNVVKSLTGQEITSRDTSASDAFSGRMQAVNESELPGFVKFAANAGLGALYNAPEMLIGTIPIVGQGLSMAVGALSSVGDKYAQLRSEGNLEAKGATADILLSGVLGAAEWGALSKVIGRPAEMLIGNSTGLKAVVGNTVKNAFASAGIGVAQQIVDTAGDQIFLGDNSQFNRSYEYFKEQGFDDGEAMRSAVYENYLVPVVNAAAVGAVTGAAYGAPNAIASYFVPMPASAIKARGNTKKVIDYGLSMRRDSEGYAHAKQLDNKLKSGERPTDTEIETQARFNTEDVERRARLARFEVSTGDDPAESNASEVGAEAERTDTGAAYNDVRRMAAEVDNDIARTASGDGSDENSRRAAEGDAGSEIDSDASDYRAVRSAVDDYISRSFNDETLSDTVRERFDRLKGAYADVAYKAFRSDSGGDISDTNRAGDMISGRTDSITIDRLVDVGNSVFSEFGIDGFDARTLAVETLERYRSNAPNGRGAAEVGTEGDIVYSSENERYSADDRSFKANTGLEKGILESFGELRKFDRERVERDIFDFTETAVPAFDRLLDVSSSGGGNYTDAVLASYSDLIEHASHSFADVYDLFPSVDMPRKIAASALHGFIRDNTLPDAERIVSSADDRFNSRFGASSGKTEVSYDSFLKDLGHINVADIMYSDDAGVQMLYSDLARIGVTDTAMDHVSADELFSQLGRKYGTDIFDPEVYRTDAEKYRRIADYAAELERSGNVRDNTPDIILGADMDLFGADIESSFRNGLAKSEGDAVELSNFVRDTLGKAVSSLRRSVQSSDFIKPLGETYNEYCGNVNKVIERVTAGKDYTDDERIAIADAMNRLVYDTGEELIRNTRARINDILSVYHADTEIAGRRVSKEAADKASGIKGMIDNFERDLVLNTGHNGSFNLSYEKYYDKSGSERTGTLRKKQVSGDAKFYYSRYQDMLVKADISNAETVNEAQKIIDNAKKASNPADSERALLRRLWNKHMLDHVDVATLILLHDEFDSSGRQTLAFEAGQCLARGLSRTGRTLQAAQIMRMMSPKAQLEHDIQLEYKRIDSEIDKFRDNADEVRREVEIARESDRRIAQKLEDERARVLGDIREETKRYNELSARLEQEPPGVRGTLDVEFKSIKERIALKREYVMSLTSRYLDNADRISESKKKLADRFKETRRSFNRRMESLRNELAVKQRELTKITGDAGDLNNLSVAARVSVMALRGDITRLSGELSDARRNFKTASDEFERMDKWFDRLYRESLELGDDIRLGFNEDAVLNKYKIDHIDTGIIDEARNLFTIIDTLVDNDELIEFIFGMSKRRKTGYGPHIRKMLNNIANSGEGSRAAIRLGAEKSDTGSTSGGIKALANIAKMQVHMWVKDQLPVSKRQKLGTAQTIMHLGNMRTVLNNIFSTSGFSKAETLTHNVGAVMDMMIGKVTGQRSVGWEMGFGQGVKNGMERAQLAALGSSLNIPLTDSARASDARVTRRTFKARGFSAAERGLGYALTVPDEFYKGIAEQRTIDSLTKLGWAKEDIELIAKQEAEFRTFNDESALGSMLGSLKQALNKRWIGRNKEGASESVEFGVGDVLLKYAVVPGNIVQRTVEYTPLGYIKALYTVGSTLYDNHKYQRKLSPMEQREMILTIARPTTGLGILSVGALLLKLGVIVGTTFLDLEYNEDKYQEAKGVNGLQINLSLLGRFARGEFDTELKNGDMLIDLSNFQPFNELIELGARIALLDEDGDPFYSREALDEYLNVPFNVFGGLSMMQTISSAMQVYDETESKTAAVGSVIADFFTGFIPGPVRHFGNLSDEYVRNPYKQDDTTQLTIDKALAKIPFARESLPISIDIWGNERKTGQNNLFADFIDAMVSPYPLSVYSENEVNDEIDRLLELSKEILPTIPYENNSVYIDGVQYSFKLENEDYEEFSRLNGNISYDAYRLMIDSYYYNVMPDSKRVEMLEGLSRESNTLAKEIWAARLNGLRTEDEIQGMIDDFMDDVKSRAAYETKTAQVLEYIVSDSADVADVLGSNASMRLYASDWNEQRRADELADVEEDIQKLQTGEFYIKGDDGEWHKSSEWDERTVNNKLQEKIRRRDGILNGTTYDTVYISGKWSELSPVEKEAILDNIDSYIEDMVLPEYVIDHIPEYKYTVDMLKTEVGREKREAAEAAAAGNPEAVNSAFADDYTSPDYGQAESSGYSGRRYANYRRRSGYYGGRNYYGGYRGSGGSGYGSRLYALFGGGSYGGRSYGSTGYIDSGSAGSGGGAFPSDIYARIIAEAFPAIFESR